MTTGPRISANRQNAAKSTGPKTIAGKGLQQRDAA